MLAADGVVAPRAWARIGCRPVMFKQRMPTALRGDSFADTQLCVRISDEIRLDASGRRLVWKIN
jgi:hypothetical protein